MEPLPPAWQVRPPRRAFPPCPLWPFLLVSSRDFTCARRGESSRTRLLRNLPLQAKAITGNGATPLPARTGPRKDRGRVQSHRAASTWVQSKSPPGAFPGTSQSHLPGGRISFTRVIILRIYFLNNYLPTWSSVLQETAQTALSRAAVPQGHFLVRGPSVGAGTGEGWPGQGSGSQTPG